MTLHLYVPDADEDHLEGIAPQDWSFLITKALDQYRTFHAMEPPQDAKGFAAHHAACRSALAHLGDLLKFSQKLQALDHGQMPQEQDGTVQSLLEEARQAVAGLMAEEILDDHANLPREIS